MYVSVCISVYFCMSVHISVCISVYVCLSVHMYICLCILYLCLFMCISVYVLSCLWDGAYKITISVIRKSSS